MIIVYTTIKNTITYKQILKQIYKVQISGNKHWGSEIALRRLSASTVNCEGSVPPGPFATSIYKQWPTCLNHNI